MGHSDSLIISGEVRGVSGIPTERQGTTDMAKSDEPLLR